MLVIAGLGRADGRERQRAVDKLFGDRIKRLSWRGASAARHQGEREDAEGLHVLSIRADARLSVFGIWL